MRAIDNKAGQMEIPSTQRGKNLTIADWTDKQNQKQ